MGLKGLFDYSPTEKTLLLFALYWPWKQPFFIQMSEGAKA